jgi:hypothetical protein
MEKFGLRLAVILLKPNGASAPLRNQYETPNFLPRSQPTQETTLAARS